MKNLLRAQQWYHFCQSPNYEIFGKLSPVEGETEKSYVDRNNPIIVYLPSNKHWKLQIGYTVVKNEDGEIVYPNERDKFEIQQLYPELFA